MIFYQDYFEIVENAIHHNLLDKDNQKHALELYEVFKEHRITNLKKLLFIVDTLHFKQRMLVAWSLGQLSLPQSIKIVVDLLQDDHALVRVEASKALANIGGNKALRSTIKILRNSSKIEVREMAAYALTFMGEIGAVVPLLSILENTHELPKIRGQAAEGLGNLLCDDNEAIQELKEKAIKILLKTMDEPLVEVRFWSIFALGCLRSREALPKLKILEKEDHRVCPGFWSIHKEAEDAIGNIEHKEYME